MSLRWELRDLPDLVALISGQGKSTSLARRNEADTESVEGTVYC
jgi:hypothetical protein